VVHVGHKTMGGYWGRCRKPKGAVSLEEEVKPLTVSLTVVIEGTDGSNDKGENYPVSELVQVRKCCRAEKQPKSWLCRGKPGGQSGWPTQLKMANTPRTTRGGGVGRGEGGGGCGGWGKMGVYKSEGWFFREVVRFRALRREKKRLLLDLLEPRVGGLSVMGKNWEGEKRRRLAC